MSADIWKQMPSYGGWTRDSLIDLIDRLITLKLTAGSVLLAAIEKGGFIGRNPVLDLAGRPRNGRMPGWIKPMNRVISEMKMEGKVTWDAVDPLKAMYDEQADRPAVYGYRVPAPLVELLLRDGS